MQYYQYSDTIGQYYTSGLQSHYISRSLYLVYGASIIAWLFGSNLAYAGQSHMEEDSRGLWGNEVSFVMMRELTQRTLCSCKPPAGASSQQNCQSSGDLRRKRSQRKRQMKNRKISTQQRGTFFQWTCEASSAAHPHSTGSLLPWQETFWLHYYCCPIIQLWSQNIFDEGSFFSSQIRPYLASESTKMSTVFQRKLKIMGGYPEKAVVSV